RRKVENRDGIPVRLAQPADDVRDLLGGKNFGCAAHWLASWDNPELRHSNTQYCIFQSTLPGNDFGQRRPRHAQILSDARSPEIEIHQRRTVLWMIGDAHGEVDADHRL